MAEFGLRNPLETHAAHAAHTTHAAHATHTAHAAATTVVVIMAVAALVFLWLRLLADSAVASEDEARDARGILQCSAINLGWCDHALLDEVAVLKRERVKAFIALEFLDLRYDNGALFA